MNQNNIRHCFFVKNFKKEIVNDDVCFDAYMRLRKAVKED